MRKSGTAGREERKLVRNRKEELAYLKKERQWGESGEVWFASTSEERSSDSER